MRRLFLKLVAILAILLSLAVCVLSWRTHHTLDTVTYVFRGDLLQAFTMPGRFHLRLSTGNWTNGGGVGHVTRPAEPADLDYPWRNYTDWNALGVGCRHLPFMATMGSESREISAPLAYLLLPCAAAPALVVASRVRARNRRRAGRCPRCGYDLRASPEKCPECGSAAGGGQISVT